MIESTFLNHINYKAGHIRVIDEEYKLKERLLSLNYPVDGFNGEGTTTMAEKLKEVEGVEQIVPRLKFAAVVSQEDELVRMMGWGVDPAEEIKFTKITMTTFQKVKLGDVCSQITDGKHGDCINNDNSGYYFISSKDVFNGSIHYENARQIIEADFLDTHRRTKLEIGDILITNSGTIGRMALIKNNTRVEKTTFQKSVAIIKPKQNVNNTYLFYKLLSLYKQLVNLGGGSAQHNLLLGDLRNFIIQIPDLPTQTRIASVLSAYDDLIENNEKRIKALEEMAQLLYAEWYVKFKFPLRLRLEQAGHEKVKMVDSHTEYGMIPEGWEVVKIDNLLKIVKRKIKLQTSEYKISGQFPIIDQGRDFIAGLRIIGN